VHPCNLHNICVRVLTLTYFSRSRRSNYKNIHNVIQLRNYCLHISINFSHSIHLLLDRSTDQVETFSCVRFFSTNAHNIRRISIQRRIFPPGGDMWKHIFAHYSIRTCGKATKCCVLVNLWNLHTISNGFWPWPTFQGHRVQTSKIYTMWYKFATIANISINFSHWIYLTRVCLLQPEFSPYPTFQFDCIYPSQA
jgi:hypothetical protein